MNELVLFPIIHRDAFITIDIYKNDVLFNLLDSKINRDYTQDFDSVDSDIRKHCYYDSTSTRDILPCLNLSEGFAEQVDASQHIGLYLYNYDAERLVNFKVVGTGYTRDINQDVVEKLLAGENNSKNDKLILSVLYKNDSVSLGELNSIMSELKEHKHTVIIDRGFTIILVIINL